MPSQHWTLLPAWSPSRPASSPSSGILRKSVWLRLVCATLPYLVPYYKLGRIVHTSLNLRLTYILLFPVPCAVPFPELSSSWLPLHPALPQVGFLLVKSPLPAWSNSKYRISRRVSFPYLATSATTPTSTPTAYTSSPHLANTIVCTSSIQPGIRTLVCYTFTNNTSILIFISFRLY